MKKKALMLTSILVISIFLVIGCSSRPTVVETPPTDSETKTAVNEEINWPTKPITLLCGYSAGGSSDLGCRFTATALEKQLGQPVIVENMPGASSWIAWNHLLKNVPKDGYTFALVNVGILFGAYDESNPRDETINDFELLANQAIDGQLIAIRNDETRFTDYKSMVEYAKEHELIANTNSITINSGPSTMAKHLEKDLGCKIKLVPLDSAKDGETMFLSKDIDILLSNVGDVKVAHNEGKYKVIILYADERSQMIADVPTEKELGLGEYVSFSARGYAYAKGVDEKIVKKMTEALKNAINDPECLENMNNIGVEVKVYTGEEYVEILGEQLESRKRLWN